MTQKSLALILASAVLTAGASAQSTKIDKPLTAELGLYIPTFSGGDKSVGVDVGLGYDVYRYKQFMVTPVLRYQYFSASSTDVNLYSYGVEANYRAPKGKYFAGLGVVGATLDADGFNSTKLAYTVQAGYGFTDKLNAFVRYQNLFQGGNNGYEAVTVGVGYRF